MARSDATSSKDADGHDKVQCSLCEQWYHRLDVHLQSHKTTADDYKKQFPGALTISEHAKEVARKHLGASESGAKAVAAPAEGTGDDAPFVLGAARLFMRRDLSALDAAFVPKHDEKWRVGDRVKQQWEYLGIGIEQRENVLFVGPTGAGKSAGVLELASVLNQPVRKINLHGDVRASNFLGEKTVDVDAASGQAVVRWQDGILPQAMRNGHWLMLEEMDAAPPAILFVLQGVLEEGGHLVLAENGGEVVQAHEHFRVIATANTLGRGDESGQYAGTNILNEAFLDRFGVVIETDYPDASTEIKIIVDKSGVSTDMAKKMVAVAAKVREAGKKDDVFCTFSLRRLIAWARKAHKLGDVFKGADVAVLNKLGKDDRKFVADLIQRIFGGLIT